MKTGRQLYITALFTFAVSWGMGLAAQSVPDTVTTIDTISAEKKTSVHSVYAGGGMGSNMTYLGYSLSHDKPFGYGYVSYGFKDHLYLSATGYTLSDLSPFIAYYNLDLSFAHTFNSWFDINLSASRYNVQEALQDTLFSSFNYLSGTLGFDWKVLYTNLSVGGLFYDENQVFLQVKNSRYFETAAFANGKALFSFNPYFNIMFGNIIETETTAKSSMAGRGNSKRPWGMPSTYNPGTTVNYNERFGLMEVDLGIPVAFSYDFFTVELEPGYIWSVNSGETVSDLTGFLLLASIYFRIL